MNFRVRFLHPDSDQIDRYAWMDRATALDIARQIVTEGKRQVQIEDKSGQLWSIEGLAGS